MPSHFQAPTPVPRKLGASSASSSKLQARGPLSRVNSISRQWDDDPPSVVASNEAQHSASSQPVPWTSSPHGSPKAVHRKDKLVEMVVERPVIPTPRAAPSDEEKALAKERRRRAILGIRSPSEENVASSSTLPTQATQKMPSGAQTAPPKQNLPSIPEKRKSNTMPWENGGQPPKRSTSGSTGSDKSRSALNTSTASNIKQKVVLSDEQKQVIDYVVKEGKNIFFTGSAGTGKSVLLRELIKNLKIKHRLSPDAVAVTASTGIAACNIGGVTLHSFGGAGIAVEKTEVLVGKIKKNKKAAARWTRTKVLIIDEVSMVDGELFDKFCKIGQMMRKSPGKPFGGIQIIVTGDFFQLPPVTKGGAPPRFCFDADTWDETIDLSVNLTKVFRQKDQRFIDMLNEMRFGGLTEASIKAFQQLARPVLYDDGIEATELFPRREDVERSNGRRLVDLQTDGHTFNAADSGSVTDPNQREKILSNFMAPPTLVLKVNAQVMLIKNMDETLVNGSMGKVIDFCSKPFYEIDSQGRYLPFEKQVENMDDEEIEQKKLLRQRMAAKMEKSGGVKLYPVVQFKVPGGGFRDHLVVEDAFKVELPSGEIQAQRNQLPLILAWAMSIHKSQGQTLDRVKVDLSKVFEKGQAYVALSRATSLEGLEVRGFNAQKVMAHKRVGEWSKKLRDLNAAQK